MPTSRDQKNRTTFSRAFNTAAITTNTTTNGTGIDVSDKSSLTFVFTLAGFTDGTYTPNIQESNDDSTYTDIAAANLIGTEAAAALTTNGISSIGCHTFQKYVRAQIISSGTTTGATGMQATLAATKS